MPVSQPSKNEKVKSIPRIHGVRFSGPHVFFLMWVDLKRMKPDFTKMAHEQFLSSYPFHFPICAQRIWKVAPTSIFHFWRKKNKHDIDAMNEIPEWNTFWRSEMSSPLCCSNIRLLSNEFSLHIAHQVCCQFNQLRDLPILLVLAKLQ